MKIQVEIEWDEHIVGFKVTANDIMDMLNDSFKECPNFTVRELPAPQDLKGMLEELELYRKFYAAWNRAESNRGCYSCCETHDSRCEKDRGISDKCTCGRDELYELEEAIDKLDPASDRANDGATCPNGMSVGAGLSDWREELAKYLESEFPVSYSAYMDTCLRNWRPKGEPEPTKGQEKNCGNCLLKKEN